MNLFSVAVIGLSLSSAFISQVYASTLTDRCGKEDDFNVCVLAAVELVHQNREGKGYADAYFTQDLDYGPTPGVIKASAKQPKTMCVAAVSEVLITALNIYYNNTRDEKPFADLPASRWNGWSARDIRDYMWENRGSHSAGDAFETFGIGRKLDFSELRPGDFLSFDRGNNSGHSTIFISYLDNDYNELATFGPTVAGFKYYSSQLSGTAGFAYRWAFFTGSDGKGVCTKPDSHPDKFRDCFGGGVLKQHVRNRGGRVNMPQNWHVRENTERLVASLDAVLRPVVEQQFASQIGDVAGLLANNFKFGLTKKFDLGNAPGLIGLLQGVAKTRKEFETLAGSPTKQLDVLKLPQVQAEIDKAVSAAIYENGRPTLNPKFLMDEN